MGRFEWARGVGSGERGSVSVIALGMIAGVLALTGCIAALSAAFVAKQRLVGAADAAAVAAADVVSGVVPGYPCERAEEAARINGATLVDCAVDGPVASVLVSAQVLAIEVRVRARAGPPRAAGEPSVEDGLEVAVFDGTRPAVERVV
jgi:secretion/DNA translocation related TadE-like protein